MEPIDLKELAKEFVKKYYPEFLQDVDDIWGALGELDLSKVSDAGFTRMGEGLAFGGEVGPEFMEVIQNIAVYYIASQQIKHWNGMTKAEFRKHLKELCVVMKINSNIDERIKSVLDKMLALSEEQKIKYAIKWTPATKVEGEIINEQQYIDLVKKKNEYEIFIIDRGEYELGSVGEVYFNNKPVFYRPAMNKNTSNKKMKKESDKYLTPLQYRILVHTLKNKGIAGYVPDLVEKCWLAQDDAIELRDFWKNVLKDTKTKDEYIEMTRKYRTAIGKLSNFLAPHLNLSLRTVGQGKYQLSYIPKYVFMNILSLG